MFSSVKPPASIIDHHRSMTKQQDCRLLLYLHVNVSSKRLHTYEYHARKFEDVSL